MKSIDCKECGKKTKDPYGKHFCSRKCYTKQYNREYPNTPRGRYNTAKKECTRTRNKDKIKGQFKLTFKEYTELIKSNTCHYCKGNLNNHGTGLDRLDNSKGYEVGNCVPCCKSCNHLKGEYLTEEETLKLIELLKSLRGGNAWS